MATWWDKASDLPLSDANFQEVLNFYLFHCPCEIEKTSKANGITYIKVAKRATTLRMQGWIGGHLNTLLSSMKHTTSGHLEYSVLKVCENVENTVTTLEKTSSLGDKHFEMIVMHDRTDMKKTSAVFYYIRNALAHGSFSIVNVDGKTIYYLESKKDGVIKARLRLREETLLRWIKDFALSPSVLKGALTHDRKQRRKEKQKGGAAA